MTNPLRAGPRRGIPVIIVCVAAIAALIFARRYFFPNEADTIRSILSEVVRKVQVTATSGPIIRAYDGRSIGGHFADQIEFSLDSKEHRERKILSRIELEQKAIGAKESFKTLEVLMLPPTVQISGNSATAETQINVLGSLPETEGQFYERHQVTFELKKIDRRWKIEKIAARDLRSPPAE